MQKEVLKYSVGIDVGSTEFHVCVGCQLVSQEFKVKGSKRFGNDLSGFTEFWTWHLRHLKLGVLVVYSMEATGVYHENVCEFLYEKGVHVSVIVPSKSKHYAKSLGLSTKTDKVDAQILARMGAERCLEAWQPFCASMKQLRSFTRQHETLQLLKNQVKNQNHAHKAGANSLGLVQKHQQEMMELIEKQRIELEGQIAHLVQTDELLSKKWQLIEPIYGVGLLTFAVIVSETNGFTLFKNERQLTKYAGYDVIENQSGKHTGKTKISKKGNPHIRRILFMPALCAVKNSSSIFAKLYHRIFEKTKIKMKAYVAVQRKLLTLIFHLWKKDSSFDENYQNRTFDNDELIAPLSVSCPEIAP